VNVTLLRNGALVEKIITRGAVPLVSLDAFYMIAPGIGYIRLNRFAETTFFEFMDAATALNEKGMKQLVLDLRGNGGGLLDEATKIADELLEDGLTIVSTRGARVKDMTVTATKPGLFEKGDIVLLIDEQSASASEVLAGALQDHDRATIMGRRSFGKGLVQEQYKLSNGGALRLTIARYYTPLGRGIQKPYDNGYDAYLSEILNRVHKGGQPLVQDTAGLKTFKTRKGKKLYEFGGILPDIWVPFDSTLLPPPVQQLYTTSLFGEWVFNIYRANRDSIMAFPDVNTYDKNFTLPGVWWQQLVSQAAADSINLKGLKETDKLKVEERIKAMMARYRWRSQGFYEIQNRRDAAVLRAVEFLQAPKS
jgi:carboxyl-terminal processing protease